MKSAEPVPTYDTNRLTCWRCGIRVQRNGRTQLLAWNDYQCRDCRDVLSQDWDEETA